MSNVTLESVQALVKQREVLEAEIAALNQVLLGPGGLGLHGGLIDAEGFPIEDVEKLITTANARHQLAVKKNDLKDLMKKIEDDLLALHAAAKEKKLRDKELGQTSSGEKKVVSPSTSSTPSLPLCEDYSSLTPFAIVNSVAPQSPALEIGLKEKDLVLKFASIDSSNNDNLKAIPSVVVENSPLVVIVKRGDEFKKLILVPKKWSGRGLLGCHLLPFK